MGYVTVNELSSAGCTGTYEQYEVFIDDCTDIGENQLDRQFSMYPNPATDNVNIRSESKLQTVSVYNLSGEMVMEIVVEDFGYKLKTSALKPGIYLLRLKAENGTVSKRLVIE